MAEHLAALPAPWEAWLGSSLAQLEDTQRLRRLRALLPTSSAIEVQNAAVHVPSAARH